MGISTDHRRSTPREFKIFQIGFNKCGTTTIHNFFSKNGLSSIHFARGNLAKIIHRKIARRQSNLLGRFKGFRVFTDMELVSPDNIIYAFYYFKQLDKKYPGSKFILNIRNIRHWIKSRLNHGNGSYLKNSMQYFNISKEEVIAKWKQEWYSHLKNVSMHFQNRPNDLLVFNIEKHNVDRIVKFFAPYFHLDKSFWDHKNKTSPKK